MKEGELNHIENQIEQIPTAEEVYSVLDEITEKEYKEVRKCEDEKGIYLLEVIVPGEVEGEMIEYSYMRRGHYKEGQSAATEIHATYYENDIPFHGKLTARPDFIQAKMRYSKGRWIIVSARQ